MGNLLTADLARLWRSKPFWLCCLFFAALSTGALWNAYWIGAQTTAANASLETYIFPFAFLIGLAAAVVCTLFLGSEHTVGFRNKCCVGHSRAAVYGSALATCSIASLLLCVAAVVLGAILGPILLGEGFDVMAVVMIGGICLLSVAYAAVFTALGMLISSQAATPVIALLLSLLLLAGGYAGVQRLSEPPTVPNPAAAPPTVESVEPDRNDAVPERIPNPNYLPDGPARSAVQFLTDFLPGGQSYQYGAVSTGTASVRLPQKMASCAAVFVLSTAAGLALFRRKDLK